MASSEFPELPYEPWRPTLETVHRFCQVVGKVRLAGAPQRNHWWNVPLHLTARGLTSRPMGHSPVFAIDFDFLDHRLDIATTSGLVHSFALPGLSVAAFLDQLEHGLEAVGADVTINHPYPFGLADSDRPFRQDTEHASYDPAAMSSAWQVLSQVNQMLEAFAARCSGKTSPVHMFWHSFDLAMTRFSDEVVPQAAGTDPVTREAYSRELISSGFWFGDPAFPEPAFYSYTAPEPEGLTEQPLRPQGAYWRPSGRGHLAVLGYEEVRTLADPGAAVIDFYDSAYRAGAGLLDWDWHRHDSPGGITDPLQWRS